MGDSTNNQRVTIELSDDHLQVWISPTISDDPQPITIEETVVTLKQAKIIVNASVLERVKEFVVLASNGDEHRERFLVATGRPAIEGKDELFHRHELLQQREQDWQGDAAVNYYTYNSIHMVEQDESIGRLIPAEAGVNGDDVFGRVLSPIGKPVEVELDTSVRRSKDDPTIIIANSPGQIEFINNILSINEVFTVSSDVDFETGSIDFPIDVQIQGTVHDGFIVKSKRAISVGGAVESATIDAENDVLVRGGILQKGKSTIVSGGDIVANTTAQSKLKKIAGRDR